MPVSLETLTQRHLNLPELDYETLTSLPSDLIEALSRVPDPRRAQGRRYQSIWLLTIAVCTIMCGHTGFRQMHELAARLTNVQEHPVPQPSTFHRFLKQICPNALDQAIAGWAAIKTAGDNPLLAEPIAIDGKELRSAKNGTGHKVHLLAATTHDTAMVLGQTDVHEKTNEITELPDLLALLGQHHDLAGRVITLDALHTQRNTAQLITDTYKAHYVLTLKGNQKTLHAKIKSLPWEHVPVDDTTVDTSHGRVVIRKLQLATLTSALLPDWPGLAQVAKLTRQRTVKGKKTSETVYVLTSLPRQLAGPGWIADLVRGHWGIENKIHHVRDTTYREDQNQIRAGHGPRNIATLTNAVLTAFRSLGWIEIRPTTRKLHAQNRLLQTVLAVV